MICSSLYHNIKKSWKNTDIEILDTEWKHFSIQWVKDKQGLEYTELYVWHTYSIEHKYQDTTWDRQFVIVNPRDTSEKILMNEKQLKLTFDRMGIHEIPVNRLFQENIVSKDH